LATRAASVTLRRSPRLHANEQGGERNSPAAYACDTPHLIASKALTSLSAHTCTGNCVAERPPLERERRRRALSRSAHSEPHRARLTSHDPAPSLGAQTASR
jgi:hypothetical protein